MCIRRFVILAASACLLSVGTVALADTVQDVNHVADTVGQLVTSPVGQLIPDPIRTILEIVVSIIGLFAGFWLKKGKAQVTQALTAVAKGIEAAGPTAQAAVKAEIKTAMKATGQKEQLDKIVDQVKS